MRQTIIASRFRFMSSLQRPLDMAGQLIKTRVLQRNNRLFGRLLRTHSQTECVMQDNNKNN